MVMIIGLTGGIATGKSTVAKMMREKGLPIIDADLISRQVVEPGEKAYKEIVKTFSKSILNENLTIDRKKLGAMIFNDKSKRERLNNIVHPAVREEMKQKAKRYLESGNETVVMDIPLLVESKLHHMVDRVLLVYIPEELQLERLLKRDNAGKEDALNRIQSQIPIEEKKTEADEIIYNDGTLQNTKEQLERILTKWNVNVT
ncbi:dephospho-CoA kinase [Evansella halocellulosilytica]|uniref:dephospho-CoA kinase n=1 Tax=Evansella halocellulosilytica TaxID=2011013 RepID=UPI000BB86CCF|nr:dephospho-CoA kinase [Evansella halocellulosilytica]